MMRNLLAEVSYSFVEIILYSIEFKILNRLTIISRQSCYESLILSYQYEQIHPFFGERSVKRYFRPVR